MHASKCIEIPRHASTCIEIHPHASACIHMHWHASRCIDIRTFVHIIYIYNVLQCQSIQFTYNLLPFYRPTCLHTYLDLDVNLKSSHLIEWSQTYSISVTSCSGCFFRFNKFFSEGMNISFNQPKDCSCDFLVGGSLSHEKPWFEDDCLWSRGLPGKMKHQPMKHHFKLVKDWLCILCRCFKEKIILSKWKDWTLPLFNQTYIYPFVESCLQKTVRVLPFCLTLACANCAAWRSVAWLVARKLVAAGKSSWLRAWDGSTSFKMLPPEPSSLGALRRCQFDMFLRV